MSCLIILIILLLNSVFLVPLFLKAEMYFIKKRLENPKYKWDYDGISRNPCITWDIVEAFSNKSWDWQCLSRNPIITWDIVLDNPDKPWDWYGLSQNPKMFDLTNNEKIQILSAKRIQKFWRRCISDPRYTMCKKRLFTAFPLFRF